MSAVFTPGLTLEENERQFIQATLAFYRGNKAQAARALGIDIRTLYSKLERYAAEDARKAKLREESQERDRQYLLRARGLAPQPQPTSAVAPPAAPFLDPQAGAFLSAGGLSVAQESTDTPPADLTSDEPAPQEPIEETAEETADALIVDNTEEFEAQRPRPKKRRGNPKLERHAR